MNKVTRREFIGTAAATTAALGASGLDVATTATRPHVRKAADGVPGLERADAAALNAWRTAMNTELGGDLW